MKYVLIILLVLNSLDVLSQKQSIPFLRMYKSDTSVITTPLKEIDSLVHVSVVPVNLTLLDIKNITNTSALFEGRIISNGEGSIGQCGFCWSTSENPIISLNKEKAIWSDNINFSNTIYSFKKNTKYYVRAFSSNEFGIYYSNQIEFTTLNLDDTLSFIKIGNQLWTSKLDASSYRNGDPIRYARTREEWTDAAEKQEGAWCYYNNDPKNGEVYGKLYNWYAVDDKRGLAPKDFHVPSDSDWTILTEFLGGEYAAVAQMKSTTGWAQCSKFSGNGYNTSGFNGLPGGFCLNSGDFKDLTNYGYWWSSSEYAGNTNWGGMTYLHCDYYSKVGRNVTYKNYGLSIRCIRD
jgi:uncharacterized protein (TIGR02145 family)